MNKRLALRMIALLTTACLLGLWFVLQVGKLEDRQLRGELKALAESLAVLVAPEVQAGDDVAAWRGVAQRLDEVRNRYAACRRIEILEDRGGRIQPLARAEEDDRPARPEPEPAADDRRLAPYFNERAGVVLAPVVEDGKTVVRALAPLAPSAGGSNRIIMVETAAVEGFGGLTHAQRMAALIVVLGLLGIVLAWRQIHHEAQVAETIRTSEEWFRGISQAALNPIVVIDDQGAITYWNDAAERALGYGRDEVAGVELRRFLIPPEPFDDYRRRLPASERSGEFGVQGDTIELSVLPKEGAAIPIELSVSTFRLGRRWHTVGVVSDLSARKRLIETIEAARTAAERANQAKSEFLANMSHEIRTPMNGVIGMTELLLDTELTPRQRDFVETIDGSAEALLTVINDILDFSKVEAGKLSLDLRPFALRDLVEGTMRTLAVRAHGRGLELAYRLGPDVPDGVLGDVGRLRQVLVNLVGNAIKFTSTGEVVATVDRVGETGPGGAPRLRFAVRDTGVGIPVEKHGTVFEAFEQADGSTTRRFGGTGLGLAIADRLVRLMGGRIEIESRPGAGSTFSFTIPLEVSAALSERVPRDQVERLAGRSVLVVDDHEVNRRIIVELLANWRIVAVAAADAPAALEAMRRAQRADAPFDLALIDHMMPGMDGLELAAEVRADAQLRSTPLLMTTSHGAGGLEARARGVGIDCILHKPLRQVDLCRGLLAALAPAPSGEADRPRRDVDRAEPTDRLRILLVEDNPVNQKVASAMLEQLGHGVTLAENGRAGVEAFQRGEFDLVLMDVQMPEMDGFEALGLIRGIEAERGTRTPVVALTAHSMRRDRDRCMEAGFDDYLSKPIRRDDLLAATAALRPPPAGPGGAFDPAYALEQAGGDAALLDDLAGLFRLHGPAQLDALRDALRRGDAGEAALAAHTLKGSAAIFLRREALDPLHQIEQLGRQGRLADAPALLLVVESLVAGLASALGPPPCCQRLATTSV